MGRFGFRYLSDTFPFMEFSQRMQFLPSDNSSHQQTIQMEFLLSANHPDSWLTIARWLTICLLEYYNKKTRQSDSFSEILAFTEIQRYGQLLLIKKHWDSSIVILSWETGKSMMFRLCSFHTLHKTPSSAQPHQVPSELPQSPHTCRRDLPL